jgi:hypothetical protein
MLSSSDDGNIIQSKQIKYSSYSNAKPGRGQPNIELVVVNDT